MGIKTGTEYIESLRSLKPTVYIGGEKIKTETTNEVVDHPLVRPSLASLALTYDMAYDPQYANVMTATSHLTGGKINIFTNICRTTQELERKVRALRLLQHKSGGVCIMRCGDLDGIAAPYSVTYDMDQKLGTDYHERFKEFWKRVQRNDLFVALAVTDPKGNRKLRPHQQKDPDLYLRVISKDKDGIVVRGAKFHQSGGLGAHEIMVTPTRALTADDSDYAVMFSVPVDTQGLSLVIGEMRPVDDCPQGEESIERDLRRYGSHATWAFFDDVFVPWENVYMCGEYGYAAVLLERFGNMHRPTYGGCFAGRGDVWAGIAAALAEIHGLERDPIIRDKITEIVYLNEMMFSGGIASTHLGWKTPSGVCLPDPALANALKINISRVPYEQARLLEDITGGILLTIPSEKDIKHPDLKDKIYKYVKEVDGKPGEERIRLVKLLNAIFVSHKRGSLAGAHGSCQGAAGGEGAAKIHLRGCVDWADKKRLAKIAAGIIKE